MATNFPAPGSGSVNNLLPLTNYGPTALTITNSSTYTSASSPVTIPSGRNFNSTYFTSSILTTATIANDSVLNLGSNPYTIEFWIKPDLRSAGYYNVVSKRQTGAVSWYVNYASSSTTDGYIIGLSSFDASNALTTSSGYTVKNLVNLTNSTLPSNDWVHVAIVRESTNAGGFKIYLNGYLDYRGTDSNTYTDSGPMYIGSGNHANTAPAWAPMYGLLSNLRIINGLYAYSSNSSIGAGYLGPIAPFTTSTTIGTQYLTSLLLNVASSSTYLTDSSGNNRTVTSTATTYDSSTPLVSGGSLNFSGLGQFVTVPANPTFLFSQSDFTIEAWIYPTTSGVIRGIVNTWPLVGAWQFRLNASNKLEFFYQWNPGGGGSVTVTSGNTISANTWTHVAIVRYTTILTMYINGAVDSASPYNIGGDNIQYYNFSPVSLTVGRDSNSTGSFNGKITNLRIVKGLAVYQSAFTPSTSPLTAISTASSTLAYPSQTSLLMVTTSTSGVYKDSSIYNATISATGAPPLSGNGPGVFLWNSQLNSNNNANLCFPAPGSILFNGTSQYLTVPCTAGDRLDLSSDTNDWTIECWVNFVDLTGLRIIMCKGNYTTGGFNSYALYTNGTSLIFGRNIASAQTAVTIATVNTVQWYHVAITRSGNAIYTYLDGVLNQSTNLNRSNVGNMTSITPSASLIIGNSADLAGYFSGYISNIRIVKGVAVYNIQWFTPPTSPSQTTQSIATNILTVSASTSTALLTADYRTNTSTSVQYLSPLSGFDMTSSSGITATNLLIYSQDFTTSTWIRTNSTSTVDSLGTGTIITLNGTTSSIRQVVSVTSGSSYTLSFYAKQGTISTINYAVKNASNGTSIVSTTSYTSSLSSSTWNRISTVFTATTSSIAIYPALATTTTGTTYLFGVQLENGTTTTNYQTISNYSMAANSTSGVFTVTTVNYAVVGKTKSVNVLRLPPLSRITSNYNFGTVFKLTTSRTLRGLTNEGSVFDSELLQKRLFKLNGLTTQVSTASTYRLETFKVPKGSTQVFVDNYSFNTPKLKDSFVLRGVPNEQYIFDSELLQKRLFRLNGLVADRYSFNIPKLKSGFELNGLPTSVSTASVYAIPGRFTYKSNTTQVFDSPTSSNLQKQLFSLRGLPNERYVFDSELLQKQLFSLRGSIADSYSFNTPKLKSAIKLYGLPNTSYVFDPPALQKRLYSLRGLLDSTLSVYRLGPFKVPKENTQVFDSPTSSNLQKQLFSLRGLPNEGYVFDPPALQKQLYSLRGLPNEGYVFDPPALQKQLFSLRGSIADSYSFNIPKLKSGFELNGLPTSVSTASVYAIPGRFTYKSNTTQVFDSPTSSNLQKQLFSLRGLPNERYVFDSELLQKQLFSLRGLPNERYVFDSELLQKQLFSLRGSIADSYSFNIPKLKAGIELYGLPTSVSTASVYAIPGRFIFKSNTTQVFSSNNESAKLKSVFTLRGSIVDSYSFNIPKLKAGFKLNGLPNTSYVFDPAVLQKRLYSLRGLSTVISTSTSDNLDMSTWSSLSLNGIRQNIITGTTSTIIFTATSIGPAIGRPVKPLENLYYAYMIPGLRADRWQGKSFNVTYGNTPPDGGIDQLTSTNLDMSTWSSLSLNGIRQNIITGTTSTIIFTATSIGPAVGRPVKPLENLYYAYMIPGLRADRWQGKSFNVTYGNTPPDAGVNQFIVSTLPKPIFLLRGSIADSYSFNVPKLKSGFELYGLPTSVSTASVYRLGNFKVPKENTQVFSSNNEYPKLKTSSVLLGLSNESVFDTELLQKQLFSLRSLPSEISTSSIYKGTFKTPKEKIQMFDIPVSNNLQKQLFSLRSLPDGISTALVYRLGNFKVPKEKTQVIRANNEYPKLRAINILKDIRPIAIIGSVIRLKTGGFGNPGIADPAYRKKEPIQFWN
jgi:hypothetical protein